jgi:hypothetical protein
MDESERRVAAAIRRHERESAEQQLRLYQRIAELERENARLTQGRAGQHHVGPIDHTP